MWSSGVKEAEVVRKNKNRGYQKLWVWNDAIELYALNSRVFLELPYSLKRVSSQQLASSDSVHRNIAEGYCRRSIKEYIQFLYIALGSLGETVSGLAACRKAAQITGDQFEQLDSAAFKLENGLLKLVEKLEQKRDDGTWVDQMIVKECNVAYNCE